MLWTVEQVPFLTASRVLPRTSEAAESGVRGRSRREATPRVTQEVLEGCVALGHEARPGQNTYGIFATCLECRVHATWSFGGAPSFRALARVGPMMEPWWSRRPQSRR